MYLLFVDESGTHGADSPVFVLGGCALHEDDAASLQKRLDDLVIKHLGRVPVNLEEYELHAGEMRNAKKPKDAAAKKVNLWANLPRQTRLALLDDAYDAIREFEPSDVLQPHWLFGVVLDATFHRDLSQVDRERFAYEVLLNKFDVMLKRARLDKQRPNRGLVIHDRRVVAEEDIQAWVTTWRKTAGDVGRLYNLADVPLFTDSRATRLLQVADLVAYALYRHYSVQDASLFNRIWERFHRGDDGALHGLVHYTPGGVAACACPACSSRK